MNPQMRMNAAPTEPLVEKRLENNPGRAWFKVLGRLGSSVIWLVLLAGALWAFGALWFDFPQAGRLPVAALVFGLLMLIVVILVRPLWWAALGVVLGIAGVMGWWFSLQPRQYRDWKPEVALLPYATIEGEEVTLHNIRNFNYQTEDDFTLRYELRRLDLRNLRGVDLFVTYWGSPYMAHPILSFDFGNDGHVCFSIETRPERGETYSALGGLYRRFELTCVVADERDVIRLRTNFRKGEEVYLYRLEAPFARAGFLEYIRTINELHEPRDGITPSLTIARRPSATSGRHPRVRPGIGACWSTASPMNSSTSVAVLIDPCHFRS